MRAITSETLYQSRMTPPKCSDMFYNSADAPKGKKTLILISNNSSFFPKKSICDEIWCNLLVLHVDGKFQWEAEQNAKRDASVRCVLHVCLFVTNTHFNDFGFIYSVSGTVITISIVIHSFSYFGLKLYVDTLISI